MIQPYPAAPTSWIDPETDRRMDYLTGVVRAVRNLRAEMNCPPGKEVKVIFCGQEIDLAFLRQQQPYLRALARVGSAEFLSDGGRPRGAATAVFGATEIYLPLDDLINLEEEKARLSREVNKAEEELRRVRQKLANGDFLAKAKAGVIEKERQKANQFEEKIRTLKTSLDRISEIQAGGS
jgi:valyl-tRNA synthetase